ncbi:MULTISPECIES: HGGxSTG domain-containing protein [Dickeya]|uniref:HGGxSTG domain-containing protein n=1 Tax=Dickeya TaxID=204037 RepID=UPI00241300AB|nr:HGGxSTG domain-containing protein [Dickeya fangzhongdai]
MSWESHTSVGKITSRHCNAVQSTTRVGTSCKRTDIYRNGRCKYHGGKSTGAKTPEGKALPPLAGEQTRKRSFFDIKCAAIA